MLRNAGPLNNTSSRLGYNVNACLFGIINNTKWFKNVSRRFPDIVAILHYYDFAQILNHCFVTQVDLPEPQGHCEVPVTATMFF